MEDQTEIDAFFEREMPGPETRPLFDEAQRLGMGLCLGYAELVADGGGTRRFNTSILVDKAGRLVGKYRKIHLPGQSAVIAPSGEIAAMCTTLGDEVATARCDLDATRSYKDTVFNFARHRRPEHYRMIVERTGAEPPP